MSQSNIIFGALIVAALIYVTVRGQLPGYLDLFRRKEKDHSSSSSNSSSGGSASSIDFSGTDAANIANLAKSFL